MILYVKYDMNALCQKILQEQFNQLNLKYSILSLGEIEITEPIPAEALSQLNASLNGYSIELVTNKKSVLVQRIRAAIVEMIFSEEKLPLKTSTYLADKLNHSYSYLANVFSTVTYTSIEEFILLQKTERAKQLLATNEFSMTEISFKLNCSSTAHFSAQFKHVTGLTPTAFQRIINRKRNAHLGIQY